MYLQKFAFYAKVMQIKLENALVPRRYLEYKNSFSQLSL